MNRLLLSVVTSAMVAGAAVPALAVEPYVQVGAFAQAAPDGITEVHQQRIAVDKPSGDLYVTDVIGDQIVVYRPDATGAAVLTTFGSGVVIDPMGIAIDRSNGDIYVSDDDDVVKFTSDGAATPTFTQDVAFTSPGVTGPLAYDEANDQLLVADKATNHIRRYGADGSVVADFDGSAGLPSPGAFAGLQDIATSSSGDIYVVDSDGDPAQGTGTSHVERYAANGVHEATFGPVDGAATVAVNDAGDRVYVSGNQDSVNSSDLPTLQIFDDAAPGLVAEQITLDPSLQYSTIRGLAVGAGPTERLYVASDVGVPYGGAFGVVSIQVQARPVPAAPAVVTGAAPYVTVDTARLTGTVDPNVRATSYWVEYGTSAGYGSRYPVEHDSVAGAGDVARPVSLQVSGLQPGTTYHYRIVASNVLGTTHGADRTVTTIVASEPATTRKYELVSPPDKHGADVQAPEGSGLVQSNPSGSVVGFGSQGAFAGSESSGARNFYRAARGAEGWSTVGVNPPELPFYRQVGSPSLGRSEDVMQTLVTTQRGLGDGGVEGDSNLYIRSGDRYRLVAHAPGDDLFFSTVFQTASFAANKDFSNLILESSVDLTGENPGPSNLYERTGDSLRIVNRLPDGSPSLTGGKLASIDPRTNSVSSDGRRIYFRSGNQDSIYLRTDGATTTLVSRSHRPGDDPTAEVYATFVGASADGSVAYFTSASALTPDATAGGAVGEMYRYDAVHDTLTDITVPGPQDPDGGQLTGIDGELGVSADGEHVYFVALSKLADGATSGAYNLYSWHAGATTYVGELDPEIDVRVITSRPLDFALSPSGRYLVVAARSALTNTGNTEFRQIYRYDSVTDEMACVSCDPTGKPATGDASVSSAGDLAAQYLPRAVMDDGRVFFDTPTPLVGSDTNGVSDAYEFVDGHARLISTGRDPSASFFADASADGTSVFFKTRERLVGADVDSSLDLYVARVGAGFPDPTRPAPRCTTDDCQGSPGVAAAVVVAATVTFAGPPNPAIARPKAPGAIRVTGRKSVKGSAATVTVRVPAGGTVVATGSGVRMARRIATRAASYRVRVALTAAARKRLARAKTFKTKVKITYKARGQAIQTASLVLTFTATTKAKGARS
jgi:hypothetical protein